MTLSIWRYSHWLLAIVTSVFVLVAAITGAILAIEPISNQLKPYAVDTSTHMSIAELVGQLEKEYEEVLTIEVDENKFLRASVFANDDGNKSIYLNPSNGQNLGGIIKRAPIYDFATNLHRSLFLKSTGRFIIGLVSFLMVVILVTGAQLIAKRQGGYRRWFSKVVKEDIHQYYHVVLGRFMLWPILVIAVTGVILSMYRFELLPKQSATALEYAVDSQLERLPPRNFNIFKKQQLKDLVSLEYPFSEDASDYFILKLQTSEYRIHQYTGQIIKESQKPWLTQLVNWSLVLHTGQGTVLWSIVLLFSCIALLFFMFSGFSVSFRRIQKSERISNKYAKDESEFIILVGSETGTTFKFAKALFDTMIQSGFKVFLDTMNNYTSYAKAKQLLFFAATYGDGDAPSGALKFKHRLQTYSQKQSLDYAVVGFGSLKYPEFCKFAMEVDQYLSVYPNFSRLLPVFKIHNQSVFNFKEWLQTWNKTMRLDLKIDTTALLPKSKSTSSFMVTYKTAANKDDTFVIQLKSPKKVSCNSGDLLAITPQEDGVKRFYSIGKLHQSITLSVKMHEFGLVSARLNRLQEGDFLNASVTSNPHFHLPTQAKKVLMIANGTGVAPFLGMISESLSTQQLHLLWGGRRKSSLDLYQPFINWEKLSSFQLAFSKEAKPQYVQDLIPANADLITEILQEGGSLMICGSVRMEKGVLNNLSVLCESHLGKPLDYFIANEQIRTDCY